jgi:16S rRNA (guanine1207-N2)-methyltransferase
MTQGHYFDEDPKVSSRPRQIQLALPDVTLDLTTDNGVFAADAVDTGTKLLLLEAAHPPKGAQRLLDLGSGYGPIALTVATRAPKATVWAVDVNARARKLCFENAAAAGLDNVKVATPEQIGPGLHFDAIYSNPPIRIGKGRMRDLIRQWLPRLELDGHAELVIHKKLGSDSFAEWLEREGWNVERVRSRQGYRILSVRRGAQVGDEEAR